MAQPLLGILLVRLCCSTFLLAPLALLLWPVPCTMSVFLLLFTHRSEVLCKVVAQMSTSTVLPSMGQYF